MFAALASALRGGALPACTHIDLALAIRAAAPPSVREALASRRRPTERAAALAHSEAE